MCSRHEQLPHVIGIGPQWATINVRQKATVVCEVRWSRSNWRLMYEPRDLEHELMDWQQWRNDGLAAASSDGGTPLVVGDPRQF